MQWDCTAKPLFGFIFFYSPGQTYLRCVLLCFINPRVRKIRNEASSCPGIFSELSIFYYVAISPGVILSLWRQEIEGVKAGFDTRPACSVHNTYTLLLTNRFVSTTTKSMKCLVNWIPLRIFVREIHTKTISVASEENEYSTSTIKLSHTIELYIRNNHVFSMATWVLCLCSCLAVSFLPSSLFILPAWKRLRNPPFWSTFSTARVRFDFGHFYAPLFGLIVVAFRVVPCSWSLSLLCCAVAVSFPASSLTCLKTPWNRESVHHAAWANSYRIFLWPAWKRHEIVSASRRIVECLTHFWWPLRNVSSHLNRTSAPSPSSSTPPTADTFSSPRSTVSSAVHLHSLHSQKGGTCDDPLHTSFVPGRLLVFSNLNLCDFQSDSDYCQW